eukprot:850239-Pleurochrysis_carterae.AAC.1
MTAINRAKATRWLTYPAAPLQRRVQRLTTTQLAARLVPLRRDDAVPRQLQSRHRGSSAITTAVVVISCRPAAGQSFSGFSFLVSTALVVLLPLYDLLLSLLSCRILLCRPFNI